MTSRSGRWTPWIVVLALAPVTACGGDDGAPDGADADADIAGTGTVEGYVVLEGETDHSAVSVVIDGTSLTDDSDSTGFWSIVAVPPGTYTVTASRPGYVSATSSPFEVRVGETTTVPPIVLHESSGTPHRLVLVSGGDQTGTVGEAFAEPIVVRLEDESAAPLSGVTLVFTPGAASGTAGGTSPATAVTAADGQAQSVLSASVRDGRGGAGVAF